MLDFILSFVAMVIIFMVATLVLVKLYRHGVKSWMVHTAIVICTLFYIGFRPFEITRIFFDIYLIVVFASIFVTEKPVSRKDYDNCSKPKEKKEHSRSLSDSILSIVLLYGIFDFFDDGDDW